jgi:hypothetical protein
MQWAISVPGDKPILKAPAAVPVSAEAAEAAEAAVVAAAALVAVEAAVVAAEAAVLPEVAVAAVEDAVAVAAVGVPTCGSSTISCCSGALTMGLASIALLTTAAT